MNTKLLKTATINSLGTAIYIAAVAFWMTNAEKAVGRANGVLGGASILLLFTLSALVVGNLVIGKPIMLYLEGSKKEAVSLLAYTIGILAAITIIFFAVLAIKY